jgi:uncharacterized membrane protein YecN with MAPEG domain
MKLSTDTFDFQTSLNSSELTSRLSERTLASSKLVMKTTSKDFIGAVSGQEFRLISSWFPIGAACVVSGHFDSENGRIVLATTLHRAFRILYNIWAIVITALVIFGLTATSELTSWMIGIFGFIFMATLFRFFLHGVYVIARKKVIHKLSGLLATD